MQTLAPFKPLRSSIPRPRGRPAIARTRCMCCAHQQQQAAEPAVAPDITRRTLALAATALAWTSQAHAAQAAEATAAAPAASSSSSTAPSPQLEAFLDNTYELQIPSNYQYLETPIPRVERGPAPERSPVLARFESPNGGPEVISILTRKASALKQTLLQVNDISQMGDPVAVATLILPRGSRLLATATEQVPQSPKVTPVGQLELPPRTYYTYEFITPAGFHVAMAAAAKKGSILICGASTTSDGWQQAGPVFRQVVRSFRLRSGAAIDQAT